MADKITWYAAEDGLPELCHRVLLYNEDLDEYVSGCVVETDDDGREWLTDRGYAHIGVYTHWSEFVPPGATEDAASERICRPTYSPHNSLHEVYPEEWVCSECGRDIYDEHNYCPGCGAKIERS
jgi:hypothetical protein